MRMTCPGRPGGGQGRRPGQAAWRRSLRRGDAARLAECCSGTGSVGAGGWLCWQQAAKERCQSERRQGGTTGYHRGLSFGLPAPLPSGRRSASSLSLPALLQPDHSTPATSLSGCTPSSWWAGGCGSLEPDRCHQTAGGGLSPPPRNECTGLATRAREAESGGDRGRLSPSEQDMPWSRGKQAARCTKAQMPGGDPGVCSRLKLRDCQLPGCLLSLPTTVSLLTRRRLLH